MRTIDRGLRTIAILEAAKGLLVLLVGLGALSLIHENAEVVAEEIVRQFHLNPANYYPRIFLGVAEGLTRAELVRVAIGAAAYALVRFVEAYGLWRQRQWAEWFAIASGGMYLPIEVYELYEGVTPIKTGLFLINLGIVIFIIRALQSDLRRKG